MAPTSLIGSTWFELLTAQDLNHQHPTYDANSIGPGFMVWRGDRFEDVGFTPSTPRINEATLEWWRFVLNEAATDRYPPAQYVFARDARAAHIRADHRKAVLDAATSMEIVLARIYENEWPKHGGAPPMKKPMLNNYVEWLRSKDVTLAVPEDRLDGLRSARNEAIHSGIDVTYQNAFNAVETAYVLCVRHTPLL